MSATLPVLLVSRSTESSCWMTSTPSPVSITLRSTMSTPALTLSPYPNIVDPGNSSSPPVWASTTGRPSARSSAMVAPAAGVVVAVVVAGAVDVSVAGEVEDGADDVDVDVVAGTVLAVDAATAVDAGWVAGGLGVLSATGVSFDDDESDEQAAT